MVFIILVSNFKIINIKKMEFVKENMYINEYSNRLGYEANTFSKNNLVGWKSRSYAIALIQFIVLYIENNDKCLVFTDNNKFINTVAPLFPNITFHVRGEFETKNLLNVVHDGNSFTENDMDVYSKIPNLIMFLCVNSNSFDKFKDEEMKKRNINENEINSKNIISQKYFVYVDALITAMNRNDAKIEEEMRLQVEILKRVNPKHAFMRFRLPYNKDDNQKLEYLQGTNFFPCWGKGISREMWLKPVQINGRYDICEWSVKDYEDYIFYHNVIERQVTIYNNPFTEIPSYISDYELLNDFDSLYETTILSMLIEYRGEDPTEEGVKEISNFITKGLDKNVTLSKLRFRINKDNGFVNDVFV